MDKQVVIYYTGDKEKMKEMKEVFEKIKYAGNMNSNYFSVLSNQIITHPINDNEKMFNKNQEDSYKQGFLKCIYSFNL